MDDSRFQLVTDWKLTAPLEAVWKAISRVEDWPAWWPSVRTVTPLAQGDAEGLGAVHRFTWNTALPYSLTFDMTVTRIDPHVRIEGRATGDLEGLGIWTFRHEAGVTLARYDWRVDVTEPWMRHLAPLLEPVFKWNHGVVMRRGYRGLCGYLAAPS